MLIDVVTLLEQLVAVPSQNPMGHAVSGAGFGEAQLTRWLEDFFRQMGLTCRRQQVEPGRENILARLDGNNPTARDGGILLFGAHQDTVPAAGMTVKPFDPEIRDGRLYGRGACDVKGGMAAILAAVARLAEERPAGMPTVLIACTANEECGFTGAQGLAQAWAPGPGQLVPRPPDAAVIAEPTGLDVVVAHKGLVRWRCHTRGRAGHSARPEAGTNAIYRMARVVRAIDHYQRDSVGRLANHPLCGHPTLSVGTIRGGVGVNTIPDLCTIEIDRRLCPQESPDQAYRHLIDHLADDPQLDFPIEHDPPFMEGPALSDEANGPLARRLADVVQRVAGPCRHVGVPYCTDGAYLAATGVPTVVFGPGDIQQAHTPDEWIDLACLRQASEVYYQFARSWEP